MREIIVDSFAGGGGARANYAEMEVTETGVPEFAFSAAE